MTENFVQQSQDLAQHQLLSQRQRQGLELLHLPVMQLEQKLTELLAENPVLEELTPEENWETPQETESSPSEREEEPEWEAQLAENDDSWREELPLPPPELSGGMEEMAQDRMLSSAAPPIPLADQLLSELDMLPLPRAERNIAAALVEVLDDDGYLRTPLADLAMTTGASTQELENALAVLQRIAPPGVGARSLPECLMLQLKRSGRLTPLKEKLLTLGQGFLERNQLPQLAAFLGTDLQTVKDILEELRHLNPAPGSEGGSSHAGVIQPDLEILPDPEHDSYTVKLCRERERRFGIAARYEKLLERSDLSAEDRNYLAEKIKKARELIESLELRGSTLLRLGRWIAETQKEFLDHGLKELKPCTMKQAGEVLQLHEATVSRAVSGKYAATPRGVYPLKFFFSAGVVSEGGETLSNRSVMEHLRELVSGENPAKPFSDDQLAKLLSADGISIARRTVAKYRELLKIPSSSMRKQHGLN